MNFRKKMYRTKVLSLMLTLGMLCSPDAQANPTGGAVVSGSAAINQSGNTLTVTNSPNAIINWQGFSIQANETTRFVQQSASSAILNRVVGADPSQLLGALQSNGRVFLVNPAGILVGQGARIDVAGLVASTLNISNQDFLAGKMNFQADPGAGRVVNKGEITTPSGGNVYLVAPNIENSGIIHAPNGEVILAAGQTVELVDTAAPGVTVEITGQPGNITNLGKILADAGRIGLEGAVIINQGQISADSVVNEGGRVLLRAHNVLNTGNLTANGTTGGNVSIEATGSVIQTASAAMRADGTSGAGGSLMVQAGADGSIFSSATMSATGTTGGNIDISAGDVKLFAARLEASGTIGGGVIHVGGGWQGSGTLAHAATVQVNATTELHADATDQGNGGEVVVWSDNHTRFDGLVTAKGGANGGDGGRMEVSSKDALTFAGLGDASAPKGQNGKLLLDPKNITIASGGGGSLSAFQLLDPHAAVGNNFGYNTLILANDNVAVTSSGDSFVAAGAGAAYLFNGHTGALLSTLIGSAENDNVGSGGFTQLTGNGNYVVISSNWGAGVANITPLGAVTWASQTSGVSGPVSSANSVVGTLANDKVGSGYNSAPVVPLSNGNYVVATAFWYDATGAATWVDGNTGHVSDYVAQGNTNIISVANSLVGVASADYVAYTVVALPTNGNYVVGAPSVGKPHTATWVNGTNGHTADGQNTISGNNSLMGAYNPYALTNGNYVVVDGYYAGGGSQRGVATWVNGATGLTSNGSNVISAANSIIGSTNNDMIGQNGVIALTNGNYVLANFNWNWNAAGGYGAATWVDGATGQTSNNSNLISSGNSVVGTAFGQQVGSRVTVLTDSTDSTFSNYVVGSFNWNNSAGAATWVNGSTGLTKNGTGLISSANSWVGSQANDMVGWNITALTNGNYVVGSPYWDTANGGSGAVTWGNGATGSVGVVDQTNSLVGRANIDYYIGSPNFSGGNNVLALPGGNYVIGSGHYGGQMGAVTWGDGATAGTRLTGFISSANSLLGEVGQNLGYIPPTVLVNGNYVVGNQKWNGNMGAVTWVNGGNGQVSDYATNGNTNIVSAANSLVSSEYDEFVGSGYGCCTQGIIALANGNYAVSSPYWNNTRGAVTLGNGLTGTAGIVGAGNSLTGSQFGDLVGSGWWQTLPSSNFVVMSPNWANGATLAAGAMTLFNGTTGMTGVVSASNSVVGSLASSQLGNSAPTYELGNGSVAVSSPSYDSNSGRIDILSFGNTSQTFAINPGSDVTIAPDTLTAITNTGTAVVLQANNDITVQNTISTNNPGGNGGNLTMQAGRSILVNANISTDNGALTLIGNERVANGVSDANRDAGTAGITLANNVSLNAGIGTVTMRLNDGAGLTNHTADAITLNSGASVSGGDIVLDSVAGGVSNSAGVSVLTAGHRWLVYAPTPASVTKGGLASTFSHYSANFASYGNPSESGNGFIYATADSVPAPTPIPTPIPTPAPASTGTTVPAMVNTLVTSVAGTQANWTGGDVTDPGNTTLQVFAFLGEALSDRADTLGAPAWVRPVPLTEEFGYMVQAKDDLAIPTIKIAAVGATKPADICMP